MDVQNHIGSVPIVDVGVIGRTCGQIAGGRTVNAGDKDVELLPLGLAGRVDELVQLDVAARRGDGPHDESERTAKDQRDDQQRDEQDLPPADLLLFSVSALATAALFAGLSAAGFALVRAIGCVMLRGGLWLPPLPPAAVRGLWAAGCGGLAVLFAAGLRGSLLQPDAAGGGIVVGHRRPPCLFRGLRTCGRGRGCCTPPGRGLLIQLGSGLPGALLRHRRAVHGAAGALHLKLQVSPYCRSAAAR